MPPASLPPRIAGLPTSDVAAILGGEDRSSCNVACVHRLDYMGYASARTEDDHLGTTLKAGLAAAHRSNTPSADDNKAEAFQQELTPVHMSMCGRPALLAQCSIEQTVDQRIESSLPQSLPL